MKPARFRYAVPESLAEALELLAGDDVTPLAGGQSLVPLLNFRLARPEVLVDLNPLEELAGIEIRDDGVLRIGAMTRQADLLKSEVVAAGWPLLRLAASHVGHPAIRNRGTVGGSVAHADPAAELPVALTALDAQFLVRSAAGERVLAPGEFFRGALSTALGIGELLVAIEVPPSPPGSAVAFVEQARTQGDFASAGVAVVHALGRHSAISLLGAGPVPLRAVAAEQALREGAPLDEVVALAAEPAQEGHRRALIAALMRQAMERVGA